MTPTEAAPMISDTYATTSKSVVIGTTTAADRSALDCHVCESDEQVDKETIQARNKLVGAAVFCLLFMCGEVAGGYFSGSLAIMTDAAHLLSDLASFLISIFALMLTTRNATEELSFGFHRAEILGALISVFLIWILTGVLVYEAIQRLRHPQPIDGQLMLIVAAVGFAVNIGMACILHGGHGHSHSHGGHGHGSDSDDEDEEEHDHHEHEHQGHDHHDEHEHQENQEPLIRERISSSMSDVALRKKTQNLNVRAAYIHVLGDMIQSLGVVIAAGVIWYKPEWGFVDPICTFVFSLIVLITTFRILRESFHVLMEGTPDGIKAPKVLRALSMIPHVINVHDLHIWSIKIGKPALCVHLGIAKEADDHTILMAAQNVLRERFRITHSTIQIERVSDHQDQRII